MTMLILYAIMVVAIIVMFWANKQSKATGSIGFKALALVCGVVILMGAAGVLYSYYRTPDRTAAIEREKKYQCIAYKRLGEFLAEKHSRAKILVIKFVGYGSKATEEMDAAKIAALEEGMAGKLKIVATEEIGGGAGPEGARGMPMPMATQFLFTVEKFDEMVDNHPECDLVLSLPGLPREFPKLAFWEKDDEERPALVLVNPTTWELKKAIQAGLISAILRGKPIAHDPKAKIPVDPEEAFNKRFMLIHSKNVEEVAKTFPKLFKKDE